MSYYSHNFNPEYPQCPQCGAGLPSSTRISSRRYDKIGATVHICICPNCHAATGYVVMDEPKPNDPYVIKKL